jgi:hypothetical protein
METKAEEKSCAEEKGGGDKAEGKACGDVSVDMSAAWDVLGQTVMSDRFLGKMDPWMNEHCVVFTRHEGDSNSNPDLHEQYSVHQQYVKFAEEWLAKLLGDQLGRAFDMTEFLEKVPDYLAEDEDWEVVTTSGDDFGCRTKGGTKDLLNHMSNFNGFKMEMQLRRSFRTDLQSAPKGKSEWDSSDEDDAKTAESK